MPVPACWVARADLRKAFSPAASSLVTTVRQVSTGAPGWQEVAVEIADQRVAAPARPDLGEGDGGKDPYRDVHSRCSARGRKQLTCTQMMEATG